MKITPREIAWNKCSSVVWNDLLD